MKIGIDIDEVIAEFLESFLKFYNSKYNSNFKKEDFKDYRFEEILGGTLNEAEALIQEHGYDGEIKLVEGALESVKELSKKHELIILTARHPMFKDKTEKFLEQHFGNIFSQILYTGEVFKKYGTTKSDLCKQLEIEFIIEDNKLFSKECAEKGIKVLLFDKPWNQVYEDHQNIIRVKDWKEVLEKLKEKKMDNCVFCNISKDRIIRENENSFTILSNPYLLKGHLLVIPKKHFESIFEIPDEILFELIKEVKDSEKLLIEKMNIKGIDIRQHFRPFQAESKLKVNHVHFHLIPREFEDELYKKSMIFEKDVFKNLDNQTEMEVFNKLKN